MYRGPVRQQEPARPLEPSTDAMEAMVRSALVFLTRFIEELAEAPASDLDDLAQAVEPFRELPTAGGRSFDELLEMVERGAAKGFNTAGPGYLAYIPGGGLFAAALADFLACGVNRFVNVWHAAPPFAQIEWTVIRWLCDRFGYPAGSGGILTSGGSMANFSAVVAARRALLPDDFLSGTLYVSEQTHASVAKAAVLAGFPSANVRSVPCTFDLAIDVDALAEMVSKDRVDGFLPFMVVGNAGTTNTGQVDPLDAVGALARQEGMWFHVDGAYGGFFQLTERGHRLFRGIEASDSITLDPHKGMFLPYGTGCLLVRDFARLREAHRVGAEYPQDLAAEEEIPSFADYSPELSRDFRGLRVWLPLMLHGSDAFTAALDEKLDLTRLLYGRLREVAGLEVPWEPQLTVVAFRFRPARGDAEEATRRLLDHINASRRVFLSSTLIGGSFVIRACIVSHRTHRDRIEEALEIIRRAAGELAES